MTALDDATYRLVRESREIMAEFHENKHNLDLKTHEPVDRYLSIFIDRVQHACDALDSEDSRARLASALILLRLVLAGFITPSDRVKKYEAFLEWVESASQDIPFPESDANTKPDTFWCKSLYAVSLGRLHDAADMLRNVQPSNESAMFVYVRGIRDLLMTYPDNTDDASQFMAWRRLVLGLKENMENMGTDGLQGEEQLLYTRLLNLFRVCSGDAVVIRELSESWVAGICAMYLFNDPTPSVLVEHYQAMKDLPGKQDSIMWDMPCRKLLENNPVNAILCLCELDLTSAAVLTEFFTETGILPDSDYYNTYREQVALKYIKMLFTDERLFNFGFDYLVNLNTPQAHELAKEVLPVVVVWYPKYAEEALATAKTLGLDEVDRKLTEAAAKHSLESRDYVAALRFAQRLNDTPRMNSILSELFRLVATGRLSPEEVSPNTMKVIETPPNLYGEPVSYQALMVMLAPVGTLCELMNCFRCLNAAGMRQCISALIMRRDPKLFEFYPLLFCMALRVGGNRDWEFMALLMDSLQDFRFASTPVQKRGLQHIRDTFKDVSDNIDSLDQLRYQLASNLSWGEDWTLDNY